MRMRQASKFPSICSNTLALLHLGLCSNPIFSPLTCVYHIVEQLVRMNSWPLLQSHHARNGTPVLSRTRQ